MERKLEFGELKDWTRGKFVPIQNNNLFLYGGNQSWLRGVGVNKFWIKRACGVTAVANVFNYLASSEKKYDKLYNEKDIKISSFTLFMKYLFENGISPTIAGIFTGSMLIKKAKKCAQKMGVTISAVKFKGKWNIEEVCKFISNALNDNKPVLILTWAASNKELRWHWVTITKIYKDNTIKMVTSNWGNQVEYDLEKWVNEYSVHKSMLFFR